MEKKKSHQFKALFLKNWKLQSRQPCTNICQILTPIICLLFTIIIREIATDNLPNQNNNIYTVNQTIIPFLFNQYPQILDPYMNRSCLQWYNIEISNEYDMKFIGFNNGSGNLSGFLGNIKQTNNYGNCSYNGSLDDNFLIKNVTTPFFYRSQSKTNNQQIYKRLELLNLQNFSSLKNGTAVDKMPDGSIKFLSANESQLKLQLKINDVRQLMYHRSNGITSIKLRMNQTQKFKQYFIVGQGMLSTMDFISQAYHKTVNNVSVNSGYAYMPVLQSNSVLIDIIIGSISSILFPLSLSLLLPVFLYNIVLQKQQKLIQMMRMNGLKMRNYWAINYLFNLILSLLTNFIFCLFGFLFLNSSIFEQTSFLLLFIVLFGWILAQISMSMLLQVFLSNSRAANIIGYLITIWTNLIGATLSAAIYQYPHQLPLLASLWPTFAFNRIFYLLFTKCSDDNCVSSLSLIDTQIETCIKVLYISSIIFALIGMYLHQIVPQQYGISQPFTFPIHFIIKKFKSKNQNFQNQTIQLKSAPHTYDNSIKEERRKVLSIDNFQQYPLICSLLTKQYSNKKLAVQQLDLVLEDRQIFGLLGPNGAGKTTLLSMITGIFAPTSGNAYVSSYSIHNEIDKVHLWMGVCPQFDILWPSLTVEEHLYFYSRLKGIPNKDEQDMVTESLKEVNLEQFRKFKASKLSGGMKRRLSIGISLVGNPRIIFLDQPTTGLDPQNRRNLWNVLSNCRKKRALFITTHLMDEADTLCDRIGIITQGTLRTIGTQFELKNKYGKGYFLTINVEINKNKNQKRVSELNNQEPVDSLIQNDNEFNDSLSKKSLLSDQNFNISKKSFFKKSEQSFLLQSACWKQSNQKSMKEVKQYFSEQLPFAKVDKEINGTIKFKLGCIQISQILQFLQEINLNYKIEWSVTNSTLEDVFMQVVTEFENTKEAIPGQYIQSMKRVIDTEQQQQN